MASDTSDIAGAALRHISYWARRNTFGGMELHDKVPSLLAALDAADDGAEMVTIDTAGARGLFDLDVKAHGDGPKRVFRSDREGYKHYQAIGDAIERLLPDLDRGCEERAGDDTLRSMRAGDEPPVAVRADPSR